METWFEVTLSQDGTIAHTSSSFPHIQAVSGGTPLPALKCFSSSNVGRPPGNNLVACSILQAALYFKISEFLSYEKLNDENQKMH